MRGGKTTVYASHIWYLCGAILLCAGACKQAPAPAIVDTADVVSVGQTADVAARAPDGQVCATPGLPCPLAADEKCMPCFAKIAQCCYKDNDIEGSINGLVEMCEKHTACRRCCDECAAKTCAQLIAEKSCPAVL